jgi:hypothetical protein
MALRNNIHRQQLFHWIGKGIEQSTPRSSRKLTDDQREEYVSHLRTSIESGLWMTRPTSEVIASGSHSFSQELPVTCFTEWSLNQSIPHTLRYGRLGLGFPKRAILVKGGQPVSYFKSTGAKRLYAKAMVDLLRYFVSQGDQPRMKNLLAELRYVLSFSRAIKTPSEPRQKKRDLSKAKIPRPPRKVAKRQKPGKPVLVDPFVRRFGLRLDLAEEREWRIVYHPNLLEDGTVVRGRRGLPPYLIPYKPGVELFTVAVPDNRTVNMVLRNKFFLDELFGAARPHVTVISLEDVGTF